MARITRSNVTRRFTEHTIRKALPYLLSDFGKRCAYSLQHIEVAGGMEIDHFDPTLKSAFRHAYKNLMPAIRHCNGKKSNRWIQVNSPVRLLNPCVDDDYGAQIFENPATHWLVGTTPNAKYHISVCDLNAPFLVAERKIRSDLKRLREFKFYYKGSFDSESMTVVLDLLQGLGEAEELFIPHIPAPP